MTDNKVFGKDGLPIVQTDKWGVKGYLTEAQQQAYDQFRQEAKEEDLNIAKFKVESLENVALRYLRARNFNIPNALQLLSECVARKVDGNSSYWAKQTPDECAQCDVEGLKKWYPHAQFGYDKFNRPVLFEHSGAVDGNAIYQMTTLEGLVRYHWYSMEYLLNEMFERAPRASPDAEPVISTCVVIDLAGFNMHHTSSIILDHVKAMIALDNTCYPEVLGKMLVVNAPWLAVSAWDMVKGWLDPRTQQKIEMMKAGPEQEARLKQFIPEDQLPVNFGGLAPPLYRKHRNIDYVHVNRYSAVRKLVYLKAHHKMVVDSYVTDGEVHLEIHSAESPFPGFHQDKYPVSHDTIGYGDVAKMIHAHAATTQLVRRELKGPGDKKPRRYLDEFPAEHHDRHFVIFYMNSARLVTRPITYSIVISDTTATDAVHKKTSATAATEEGEDVMSASTSSTVLTQVEQSIAQTSLEDTP